MEPAAENAPPSTAPNWRDRLAALAHKGAQAARKLAAMARPKKEWLWLVGKAHDKIDAFNQTLVEGHYRADSNYLWMLLFKPPGAKLLPQTSLLRASSAINGTTKILANRFLWGSVFALLSIKTLAWTALGMAGAGVAMYGAEYKRSQRTRRDKITETNFAGQTVEGERADLCRLHIAQQQIMNLSSTFKKASMESTSDTVRDIIAGVATERARVRILAAGPYGADSLRYAFSEPAIKLAEDGISGGPKPLPAREDANREVSQQDLLDRVRNIEQMLQEQRAATRRPPPPPRRKLA